MKTLGRHLIIELYACSRQELLNDLEGLRALLLSAAEAVGATVLGQAFHRYSPQGVSGTLVIAESHLSIHTWPEHSYVAVDIFTCGGLDPRPGVELLAEELAAGQQRVQEILRGLPEELAEASAPGPDAVQLRSRLLPWAEPERRD